MKLRAEKIKCALNASPRLQSQKSPLLLMGLEKMFRTKETKAIASPFCFSLSLSPFLYVAPYPAEGEEDRPSA